MNQKREKQLSDPLSPADVPTGTGWSVSILQEFFILYKMLHLKSCHHSALGLTRMEKTCKSVEVRLREKTHSQRSQTKRSSRNGLELGKDKNYMYTKSQRSLEVLLKRSLSKQWQLTLHTGQPFPCPKSRTIQWNLSNYLQKGLLYRVLVHSVFLYIQLGKVPLMYSGKNTTININDDFMCHLTNFNTSWRIQ